MEIYLLAIQARVLMTVGLVYICFGLWIGTDPTTLAWRATVAAVVAMIAARWLLRQVALVVEERMSADMAERQFVAEQATATGASPGPPGTPATKAILARMNRATAGAG